MSQLYQYIPVVAPQPAPELAQGGDPAPMPWIGLVLQSGGTTTYTYSGAGTVTFSGAAATNKTKAFPGAGTLTLSGSAATSKTKVFAGTGTLTLSGAAATLLSQSYTYAPSGAVTFSGSAATSKTKAFSGAGTLTFSGAAATSVLKTYTYAPSGTLTFSGAAATNKTKAFGGSGTLTFSGAAATSYTPPGATTYAYTGAGTITFSGAAAVARIKVFDGAGAVVLSGAASTSYAPGTSTWEYVGAGQIVLSGTAETFGPIVRRDTGAGKARHTRRRRYIIEDRLYDLTPEELAFALEQMGKEPEDAHHVKRLAERTERKVQEAKRRNLDRARPVSYIRVADFLPEIVPRLEPLDTDTLIAVYEALQVQQRDYRLGVLRSEEEMMIIAAITS